MTFEEIVNYYNNWKNSFVYVWVKGDGTLLSPPDTDKKKLLALKADMDKWCADEDEIVRLVRYKVDQTEVKLYPPPDPEEEKQFRGGGHALGGRYAHSLEDVVVEFKDFCGKLLKCADELVYGIEGNVAFIDRPKWGIRVEVERLPDDQVKRCVEYGSKLLWRVRALHFRTGNKDMARRHVGDYSSANVASEKAILTLAEYELDEWIMDQI